MKDKPEYKPPWFTLQVIGIAGPSASGKTSVAKALVKRLNVPWVVLISTDSFYKPLTPEESQRAFDNEYDFDAPSAWDWDLMVDKLRELKEGRKVEIPKYSFVKHRRLEETATVYGANVIILEGNLALHEPRILDLLDMKIYIHEDSDVCLSRRLVRDINERGRHLEGILKQYFAFVKPANENYVHKQAHTADIVIPHGPLNIKAIDMVAKHISINLADKSAQHMLDLKALAEDCDIENPLPSNIIVLEPANQLRGMITIIQDRNSEKGDFIFYIERISSIVLERALNELPYSVKTVVTPGGHKYDGLQLDARICGVEIVRAGGAMRTSFSNVFVDAPIGKVLIQTSEIGEPLVYAIRFHETNLKLHFLKLPKEIERSHVIVMDVQIATPFASTALMAIRILLDHGVPEDHITFITILASSRGLQALGRVFPNVKVVAAALDETLAGEGSILSSRWLGVEDDEP